MKNSDKKLIKSRYTGGKHEKAQENLGKRIKTPYLRKTMKKARKTVGKLENLENLKLETNWENLGKLAKKSKSQENLRRTVGNP